MIYDRDSMKRYGKAVAAAAKAAIEDVALSVQTQIALNPNPEAVQACLDLNIERFKETLDEKLAKLEATV